MLLIKIHTVSANSNLTTNNNPRVNVLAWNRFTETLVDYLLPLLQNRPEQDHPTVSDYQRTRLHMCRFFFLPCCHYYDFVSWKLKQLSAAMYDLLCAQS